MQIVLSKDQFLEWYSSDGKASNPLYAWKDLVAKIKKDTELKSVERTAAINRFKSIKDQCEEIIHSLESGSDD